MQIPPLPVTKAWSDLKDPRVPGGEKAFHVQLGRGAQKPRSRRDRVDVTFQRGGGDANRRFDLDEIALQEEIASGLQQPAAQAQITPKRVQTSPRSGLAHAIGVLTGPRIDPHRVTLIDEYRHLELVSALNFGGLQHIRGRIAASAGFRIDDDLLHECR